MKALRWGLLWPLVIVTTAMAADDWPETAIRLLPDASFAVIETDAHGRKHRHCPYRNGEGQIDEEQLIRVLGRLEAETWQHPASAAAARQVLERHYQRLYARLAESAAPLSVDLNAATLCELVRLPGIGPVLAVRITDYRERRAAFTTVEDIMKVDGINRGTFMAIRHYIRTD